MAENIPYPPPRTFIGGTPTSGVPTTILPEVGYWARSEKAGTSADFYVKDLAPTKVNQNIQRKTEVKSSEKTVASSSTSKYVPLGARPARNVLNYYRSANYNFTLAALTREQVNNPSSYIGKIGMLDLVIATSKGKGTTGGMQSGSLETPDQARLRMSSNDPNLARVMSSAQLTGKQDSIDLVDDFNKTNAGRFDLFIDNVVVDHTFAFNKESTTSLPLYMTFDVIEPYSMTGFLDALNVAARSAQYNDIRSATFLMIMDFAGYPDSQSNPGQPVDIPYSARYFAITIVEIKASVDQRGSVYQCKAVPVTEVAYGETINTVKTPTSASGNTVKEMLSDVVIKLNQASKDDAKVNKLDDYDEYAITFPIKDQDENLNRNAESEIASGELLKNGQPFNAKLIDPETTNAAKILDQIKKQGYTSLKPTAQWNDGTPITSIIENIVHSSSYVQNKINNGKVEYDENYMTTYFKVEARIENKSKKNPVTNLPYQKFTYEVIPYKVLFTKLLPLRQQDQFKLTPEIISRLSFRQYDYIYSGVNTDIMDFQIKFNNLLFIESGFRHGNSDQPASTQLPSQDNATNTTTTKQTPPQTDEKQVVSVVPRRVSIDASKTTPAGAVSSNMPNSSNNLQVMSNITWNNITSLDTGLLTCDITILGDPYFLVMGGMSNYSPTGQKVGNSTDSGEASISVGEVFIAINFRNPTDINADGMYEFYPEVATYSGLYSVVKVKSEFRNGLFKQYLKLVRAPGQTLTSTVAKATEIKTTPKVGSQYQPSTAPASGSASSSAAGTTTVLSNNNAIGVGQSNSVDTIPSIYQLTPTLTPDKLSSTLRLGKSVNASGDGFALSLQGASKSAASTVVAAGQILNSSQQQLSSLAGASGVQTSSLYSLGNNPSALIGGIGLKASGALSQLFGVSSAVSGLSSKLDSLANYNLSKTLLPQNVNLNNLGGLLTSKISTWPNVPASSPRGTIAPTTAWPDGNLAADESSMSTDNPLAAVKLTQPNVSLGALVGTLLTGAALVKSLTGNKTSIESNITQTQQLTSSKIGGNMNTSAATRYGSKGATGSPLKQYVKK